MISKFIILYVPPKNGKKMDIKIYKSPREVVFTLKPRKLLPIYLGGVGLFFFFSVVLEKKIITNSYFTLMFIWQNVGNLKGFLLVYLYGLYLITLSSYSSTSLGTSYSNNKKNQIKYLSIQLLIRGTCRGATELWNKHREFPYLTSLFF